MRTKHTYLSSILVRALYFLGLGRVIGVENVGCFLHIIWACVFYCRTCVQDNSRDWFLIRIWLQIFKSLFFQIKDTNQSQEVVLEVGDLFSSKDLKGQLMVTLF